MGSSLLIGVALIFFVFHHTHCAVIPHLPIGLPSWVSSNDTGPRIVHGDPATLAATKHQVSIRRKLNDGYFFGTGHICGGSLIASDVVLSAAHCFVDYNINNGSFYTPENFIVVMGNLDRFVRNEYTLVFDVVKLVFAVDFFNLTTYEDDVAVVFLNDSVPVNHPTVAPIELNRKDVPGGTICQVTGWGTTENDTLSDILMTVDVPIIDYNVCVTNSSFDESLIIPGMFCAGYLDEGYYDACDGDSGGPMVCNSLLTGIVSWGTGCALPTFPGVYTNVSYFASWIDEQLAGNGSGNGTGNGTGPGGGGGGGGAGMSSYSTTFPLIGLLLAVTVIMNEIE